MTHIYPKVFGTLNWLPMTKRLNQYINSIAFKHIKDQCPNYLNEVFQIAPEKKYSNQKKFFKVKMPLPQNHLRSNDLVYHIGLTIWSKTSNTLSEQKISTRLNII